MVNRYLNKYNTFVILMLAIFLFISFFDGYGIIGDQLLQNSDFSDGLTNWKMSGPESSIKAGSFGEVVLFSDEPTQNIKMSQKIFNIEGGSLLEITGELKTINVIPGNQNISWHRARLHVSSYNKQGSWLSGAVVIAALKGDTSWHNYSTILRVNPEAVQVRISAQLLHCTGTFMLKNLSLRTVYEKPIYSYLKIACFFLLSIYIVWLSAPYVLNSRSRILKLFVLLVLLMILFGILLPKKILFKAVFINMDTSKQGLTDQSLSQDKVHGKVKVIENDRVMKRMDYMAKAGHFILFLWLGLCLASLSIRYHPKKILMDITCFAGITELMQVFIEGRTPLLMDCLIDISGGILGILIFLALRRIWEKNKPVKRN